MKFSIISPTYNSENTINRNIQSLLIQTHREFEHIIIDNVSADETLNLIRNAYEKAGRTSQLKIISEKDRGVTNAFNKGIGLATGEVIGILNGDDFYYHDEVFEKVIRKFEDKNVLFVHGNLFFDDPDHGSNVRRPLLCPIQYAMPYNHPTMFFRKVVYDTYGLFNEEFNYAMDFEFICRLEKMIANFREKGIYINGKPLVAMAAGGISWKNEIGGIKEIQKALKHYGFWNTSARRKYFFRILRTKVKYIITALKLYFIIKLWRKNKWS